MSDSLTPVLPRRCLLCAILLLMFSSSGRSQTNGMAPLNPAELGGLDIEDLMKIQVTTVARKEEAMSAAPAAITVLSQEDIRRSGFTTVPDVLRLVPGLEVARLDAHDWAISARGFNDIFANKLQVMVDGQSVYTPLFSGVFWDEQTGLLLEDIDHIEVVRGPGGSVWGANAVNGVINIITKSAQDTQGGLLAGFAGTEERLMGGVRYGGELATNVYYRAFVRYEDTASSTLETGAAADDDWYVLRSGFRVDWDAPGDNQLTLKGDVADGKEHQVYFLPTFMPPYAFSAPDTLNFNEANLLARWVHTYSDESDLQLQVNFEDNSRQTLIFKEVRRNYGLDFQHRFTLAERHDLVWGMNYHASTDELGRTPIISFNPTARTLNLFSAFVQDEMALVPDRLSLVAGSKFEHNDFTGFEVQPTGRLLWRPTARQSFWAAVSRAVRTPSRAESDIQLVQQVLPPGPGSAGLPTEVLLLGNPDFTSESLIAYELGYRAQWQPRIYAEVDAFYNDYSDLRSVEPGVPLVAATGGPPHQVLPYSAQNDLAGHSFGGEASLTWQATDWWRLRPGYSFVEVSLRQVAGRPDPVSLAAERASPRHQLFVASTMNLGRHVDFDANLRYVDALTSLDVPAYWELDLRVAWRPRPDLELSLVGQNLLQAHHLEFSRSFINEPRTELDRGFYGKITWRF